MTIALGRISSNSIWLLEVQTKASFFTTVLINKKLNWQMGRIEFPKDFYFLKLTLSMFLIYIFGEKKKSLLKISMLPFLL